MQKQEENNNMEIYNDFRSVPEEAKKPITAGRLKGMTDIKPMWRIEKLTERFGACGIGWKAPIVSKQIIDLASGEKIAIVDIDLYYKYNGEWSEPVHGTGGNMLVAKESAGLHTNDEGFKMAYSDALSVACKSLGMGADVYWGDDKYNTNTNENQTTYTKPAKQNYEEKKDVSIEEALNYQLTFGKYKGKSLKEIDNTDPNYVEWLAQEGKFQTKDFAQAVVANREEPIEITGDQLENLNDEDLPF